MHIATPENPAQSPADALRLGAAGPRMIAAGLALAVAGLALAGTLGWRDPESRTLFCHAYLVALLFYLTIALGGLFFVLLHHLARAGWSVTLRRLAEALAANLGLLALLALPLSIMLWEIYPWAGSKMATANLPAAKAAYLSPGAFVARLGACFAVWVFLAWYLRSRSIRQDASGDVRLSRALERMAAPGMIAFGVTLTVAAVDLVMSLNPDWSSTIIGVYLFGDVVLGGLCTLVLLALALQTGGRLGGSVSVEHYHDLGKLIFSFVIFWGYIAFSQYLLMWYANMPGETQFYMLRQIGPWAAVSIGLLLVHLVIPLFGLMPRAAKRRLGWLGFWAAWLLAANLLDLFWLVMPHVLVPQMAAAVDAAPGTPLPELLRQVLQSSQSVYQVAPQYAEAISAPLGAASLAMLIGLLLGLGGLFLANTARMLKAAALVPVEDPRLAESLAFENT
ncbi:MAG: hypothetical protein ABSF26_11325 [Thermoguttaceae bacterium]|jgi:hypothetical protein